MQKATILQILIMIALERLKGWKMKRYVKSLRLLCEKVNNVEETDKLCVRKNINIKGRNENPKIYFQKIRLAYIKLSAISIY